MFTGLVEEIGRIKQLDITGDGAKIAISCRDVLQEMGIGDSIAVDGVCLTVIEIAHDYFVADVMFETIDKTAMIFYAQDTSVNLERALSVGQRMGGHFVQGHVDGTGIMEEQIAMGNAVLFRFSVHSNLVRWMVEKGSITVNGVSLTLIDVGEDFFTVSVIPHTLEKTCLGQISVGDKINVECDIIGKYLAKWSKRED